ncbi:hypothetical protein EV191_114111 [Tamaricihabitans halophyticus]|uniref:FAR-17a/AIG1-like protein n=1 Tax=Tamaricihabitans halophyticus TaxID=1262583 RepID=A0A4R2QD20_9PSEU|nr:hypothetical protein [Tamaricihabitans halophyticus]TCP46314.1 hypothetical protein EV191_114111 [Tamaricihabitans halophyticus]
MGTGYPGYPGQQGQVMSPPMAPTAPPTVSVPVLLGVSAWRLLIVVFALIGFGTAVNKFGFDGAMPGLSQQASLFTALVYFGLMCYPLFTVGRRHEPVTPWWRGATLVVLVLVCVTFMTMLSGRLDTVDSLFEHLLTPLVVLLDWLFVGRNQAKTRWWHPLTWVVFPALYLGYFVLAEVDLYGSFLDPSDSGFATTVLLFVLAVIALGYLLYGIGKLRAALSSAIRGGFAG